MLVELRVENLGLLREAHLELGPGLNVITGETGAGKTLCVEALGLACGGRSSKEAVGPWGSAALVEARFLLEGGLARVREEGGASELRQDGPGDGSVQNEVVVRRVVEEWGRSRQYLNGRMVSVGELEALFRDQLRIYGQLSLHSLAEPRYQLEVLDRYCGVPLEKLLEVYSSHYDEAREVLSLLENFEDPGEIAREVDFLKYQISEIEAACLQPGEELSLEEERRRLEAAAVLKAAASEAVRAAEVAEDSLWKASLAGPDAGVDRDLDALRERARALAEEARELRRGFRAYGEAVEVDPQRLEFVTERLDTIRSLERKYGAGTEAVLAFAEQARKRLEELEGSEAKSAALEERRGDLEARLLETARRLSELRRRGAEGLQAVVGSLLSDLGMPGATFGVEVEWCDPSGIDRLGARGGDKVRFVYSASREVSPRPLQKVASGGELARLMLAIEVATSEGRGVPTLVFDEIDQGVGGEAGSSIGELLHKVAAGRQVLCVTHLAQVASFGDAHFLVEKGRGGARLARLDEEERVVEISRMLGGLRDSRAANRHAEEILRHAARRKAS